MTLLGAATATRRGGGRMRATARVATVLEQDRRGVPVNRLAVLRSEGPLTLRPTIARRDEPLTGGRGDAVRLSVVAGAAGPVGGDLLTLDVHVGAGSTLVLAEISHTIALPGRDGAQSLTQMRARVDDDATLVWLPEPVIAAHACNHVTEVVVELGCRARLLLREELLLGRHGEPSGHLRQRTRISCAGRPIHQQDLFVDPDGAGAAVTGRFAAVGSILVVDPAWLSSPLQTMQLAAAELGELAALLPLSGGAVLVAALAPNSLDLRRSLDAGLRALGAPWGPA